MAKFLFLLFFVALNSHAQLNIMRALYLADKPGYAIGESTELSMIGEFGMVVASGNTNTKTITAKMNTSQELPHWSYQVISDLLYKRSSSLVDGQRISATSAQKLFVSGQIDYKLKNPDNRIFLYAEYEDKRFSGFDYQSSVAAGWTSRLWRDETSELKYSLGPGYAISKYESEKNLADDQGVILRAAFEYKRKFSKTASFRQFVSAEAATNATKTKSETSLSTKINAALAMKLTFVMNHDTSVDSSKQQLDTETAVTLVYQFF
jgi:putative salt-induced outer membrane protein